MTMHKILKAWPSCVPQSFEPRFRGGREGDLAGELGETWVFVCYLYSSPKYKTHSKG